MSEQFIGLTRRLAEHVYQQETSEELSHIIDEAREHGSDAADALIELALGDEHLPEDDFDDEETEGETEFQAVIEEECDDDEDEECDSEDGEDSFDEDLEELEGDFSEDDDELTEQTFSTLRHGELLII